MKKFLALFLALMAVLTVSLVACGDGGDSEGETTTTEDFYVDPTETTTNGSNNTETTTAANDTWITDGNTVYIVDCLSCNVRTSDSTSSTSNIAGTVKFGESYTRVKYNNKWSVIMVDGNERYIKTDYVTADKSFTVYTEKNATVYVTANTLNLRWCYFGTDDDIAVIMKKGAALTQTGVSSGGWIRVEYEGNTLYCNGNYVSETEPTTDTSEGTQNPGPVTPPVVG
ncbi:MAG: hypothetical protein IJY42_04260 [Clostridia bacterium]|nr:hypothetical protein [Clostridia bacterium]